MQGQISLTWPSREAEKHSELCSVSALSAGHAVLLCQHVFGQQDKVNVHVHAFQRNCSLWSYCVALCSILCPFEMSFRVIYVQKIC